MHAQPLLSPYQKTHKRRNVCENHLPRPKGPTVILQVTLLNKPLTITGHIEIVLPPISLKLTFDQLSIWLVNYGNLHNMVFQIQYPSLCGMLSVCCVNESV